MIIKAEKVLLCISVHMIIEKNRKIFLAGQKVSSFQLNKYKYARIYIYKQLQRW